MSAMPTPENGDLEILTIEDVARLLQVTPATVRQWRRMRTGPRGFRMGKGVRYRRSDVEQWIDQLPKDDQGD